MLIDSRLLPPQTIETDICIIGSGPAGITIAREFMAANLEVALLESGGFLPDAAMQSLAGGETVGSVKPSIDVNRRQFGGNANNWGVQIRCGQSGLRHALFDEIDFLKRDWIPHSGWPFQRDHLMAYYRRAQVVCQAGPFEYTPDYWEDADCKRWPLDARAIETGMFQFSAADAFIKTYRNELTASRNVTVYTHASVVELITSDSTQAITKIRVARPGGGDVWVSAKRFILAAGGFENARLLLISNRQQQAGLGNQHDVVGRYYHDHPQGRSGYLKPRDPDLFKKSSLYDMHQIKGAPVMGYLKLSQTLLQKEKLLNINCFLFPKPDAREDEAIQSFNMLRDRKFYSKKNSELSSVFPRFGAARHVFNVACGVDYVAKMGYRAKTGQQASNYGPCQGGWSLLDKLPQRFKRIEVWHSIEQSPHPDNRVTLSNGETDMFGCPRLKLKWHWSASDIDQIQRAQAIFAKELNRAGLGTLEIENDPEGLPNIERPAGSHHLMGATRMHENPRFGVVDANCRVHGIKNLFIAGSSTFPTGGYANPTLTIIAMALRLSDFLKQELAAEESLSRLFLRGIELHSNLL